MGFETTQARDVGQGHTVSMRFSCLARRHALLLYAAPEKAGTFRCMDIGIGETAVVTVVHAEQHAAVDRFGSPN